MFKCLVSSDVKTEAPSLQCFSLDLESVEDSLVVWSQCSGWITNVSKL